MRPSIQSRSAALPREPESVRDGSVASEGAAEPAEASRPGFARRGVLTALGGLAGAAVGGAAGIALGYRFSPQVRTVKLGALAAPRLYGRVGR